MYVYELVEKLKVSTELKARIEEIIEQDDKYSLELQEYLQNIYKVEKEVIEKLRSMEQQESEAAFHET
jgi:hypothetical protein